MNPPETDASSSLSPAALEAIARLERLDAVGRVIAPVVAPEVARAFEQTLVGLSRALVSVRSHGRTLAVGIGSPEAAAAERAALEQEVQRVETALGAHAVALRGAIDGIPLPVLRKALVAAEGGRPGDLLALLDLVLEEPARLPARCDLLDYLTTLLSTESRAGRHRVARDPVTLTPALAATCERLAAASGEDLAALEREFVDAAHRCESGDIGTVIPEMRARKTAVGAAIFAPGVLRAVVYYNATVATALRSRLDADRSAAPAPSPGAARRDVPRVARDEAPEACAGALPRADAFLASPPPGVHVPPPAAGAALPAAGDAAAAPPGAAAPQIVTPEASVHWKLAAPQPPPVAAREEAAPRRSRRWMAAGAGGAALAAACAVLLLSVAPPDRAQPLSAAELQHLPTFVKDGYRDHARKGSLFIGTVGPDWAGLPPAERRQNADRLVAELSHSGIREILLYDSAQRLVVHHADGLPLRML